MNLLLGFGKQRLGEDHVASKMQRSHSWDSTFLSLKLKPMKKRDKQPQSQRGGLGVKERQLKCENREELDLPSSSRRVVLWNRKAVDDMEEEIPPLSKEVQQQLFMQRLFLISKKHLDETPPERRMSLLSSCSPGATGFLGKDLEPQRSLITIGPQGSYVSVQQNGCVHPSKSIPKVNEVSGKTKRQNEPWTVESVVTSFTSSCSVFDSLCTPSLSLLTSTRPPEKRRDGPFIPTAPPSKRRTVNPLEQPIPIPVTISFTKNGPPLGWENLSLERHFAELEKYEKDMGLVDTVDDTDPIMEDRQREDEDQASSTGFISLTSSIPTRRSHGLWSTTDLR